MLVMVKRFLLFIVFFTGLSVNAQLYELGILGGGSNYLGDVGRELYIYPSNYYIGGVFKHNVNERFGLRLAYTYTTLRAKDAEAFNEVRRNRDNEFENTIHELSAGIEFNYWKFNIDDHRYTHTPYLLFEGAIFWHNTVVNEEVDASGKITHLYKNKIGYTIPFGVGYKFRLFRDIVMGFEVRGRYTFTDALDYNNKDFEDLKFGNPDTNDWYFFSGIQLTYWFGRPPCHSPAFR